MNRIKFTMPFLFILFVICMFLISTGKAIAAQTTLAEDQVPTKISQALSQAEPSPAEVPDLSDIIPLATELSGRLATLEKDVADLLDVSAVEARFSEIEENLSVSANQFESLKKSENYSFNRILDLSEEIKQEIRSFEEPSKRLSRAIDKIGTWRDEWLKEKNLWKEWQSSLLNDRDLGQLRLTFKTADKTIDTALNIILPELEAMLSAQAKAGKIGAKLLALKAGLDPLLVETRRDTLLKASPPMFSPQYFSQFGGNLWLDAKRNLNEIAWPGTRFFSRHGWIILVQVLLSLFAVIAIYRNRRILKDSKRLHVLAARPFSAGLFLSYMATIVIYEYIGAPVIWKLAIMIVSAVSFARLMGCLIEARWKKNFIYWLMAVFIVNSLMDDLGLPLPLFSLYIFLAALTGLLLCLRWAGESGRRKDPGIHKWLLRLGSLFFAFIVIAEIWGGTALPMQTFLSSMDSMVTILAFMLLMLLIHGILECLLSSSPLHQITGHSRGDADAVIRRSAQLMYILVCGFVLLPAILMIWGAYYSLEAATKGLLSLGFNLGSLRITVGLLIAAMGVLYGSFLVSWILEKLLMDEVFIRHRMIEKGVRFSIARLVHYVFVFAGFLLAISVLGFDITKLTIMLSALGIGIGFGLQNIVNNFVSGLVLLFERPVRVEDTIEIGGRWAVIKRIGLRATTVETFDQADVIIPNADLIANQVTNWTLGSRQVRLIVPVGVAYGSDVPLVIERLMACAHANSMVAKSPEPQVLFLSFGESTLDFELRVWVDLDLRLKTSSELHQEIDRSFREAKIEIAFPQQDLHLRSVDAGISGMIGNSKQ